MAVDTIFDELGKMTVARAGRAEEQDRGGVGHHGRRSGRGRGARRRRRRRRRGGGEDLLRRRAHRGGRPEDPGDQGRARGHRSRPQGGEGPRRLGSEAGQGGRRPGGGRPDQGAARGSRRDSRAQVATQRGTCLPPPFVLGWQGRAFGSARVAVLRARALQFRPISATAAASACGEGGCSGTLAGCADVRPLAAPTPISCPFSHASREAVLLDHHGRFAPRSYDFQPSRARSRPTQSHRHPEVLVRSGSRTRAYGRRSTTSRRSRTTPARSPSSSASSSSAIRSSRSRSAAKRT